MCDLAPLRYIIEDLSSYNMWQSTGKGGLGDFSMF